MSNQTGNCRDPGCDNHQKDGICTDHYDRCLCVFQVASGEYKRRAYVQGTKKTGGKWWVRREGIEVMSDVASRARISAKRR